MEQLLGRLRPDHLRRRPLVIRAKLLDADVDVDPTVPDLLVKTTLFWWTRDVVVPG